MFKKPQQIKLMSKPGLALIAIAAISVAAVAVALQASFSPYYYMQAADAQQEEQEEVVEEEEQQPPTEETEDTDEVEEQGEEQQSAQEEQDIEDGATITSEDNNNAEGTVPSQQQGQGQGAGTGPRLPPNSVTSENIVDGQVQTQDLADDAVTSEKIRDGEVTSADIRDGTITSEDIAEGTIPSGGGEIVTFIRTGTLTIPAGGDRQVQKGCNEGETVTGGGFATSPLVKVYQNNPFIVGIGGPDRKIDGWSVRGQNTADNDISLNVYVVCAKIVPVE